MNYNIFKPPISLKNIKSGNLWSLWNMLETGVWHLVNHTAMLTVLKDNLQARRHADRKHGYASGAFTNQDKKNISAILDLMSPWLEDFGLDSSMDRITRIRGIFTEGHDEYSTTDKIITQLEVLTQTLEDELKRHVFLYIDPSEVSMYNHPYKSFQKTVKAFPSSGYDIIDACRCYALGQATACVFHSMGILQSGLYALAKDMAVEFKHPIELENWKNIIDQIETKIHKLQNQNKSSKKDADLKFYSKAAIQFRYFKDAWRNHVCHLREHYDIYQAKGILLHVTDFMETLSDRLYE